MNVPPCITNQLTEWQSLKFKNKSIQYAIKAHKVLIRFYRVAPKNRRRAKMHYSTYLKFNSKSFNL